MAKSKSYNSVSLTEGSAIKRAEKRENTRSYIALVFIIGYLIIIGILIILSTFFELSSDMAKDYLLTIGSPLGFIIGYYFKTHEKD